MNKVKTLITVSAFSLLVLCLPAIASAQYGNGGYGNGGYNNGQYGNYGNYGDMRSVLRDLKSRTNDFQHQLDRDLDHSRINGSRREDQINQLAKDFKSSVNRLNTNGNYVTGDVNRVFSLADQIDRTMGRSNIGYNSQNLWGSVRSDLNALRGNGYNNGGYNNGRNNYPNNNRNGNGTWNNGRRPSWWPF